MAYLGKVRLADVAPNHPFSHTCIILGGQRPPKTKQPLPLGQQGVIVAVKWENEDWHAIVIEAPLWCRIRLGERIVAQSEYSHLGKSVPCHWYFNESREYSLKMDYRVDEGFGYDGDIRDVHIVEIASGA